ncbi:MAG: CDP-alcohol phosphatidyltransferase family protein [Acidimicrobiales bacterium]
MFGSATTGHGAAWLLAGAGFDDWVDGWFARRFAQVSEFGKLFDPLVDRLMFLVAIPCLLIDGSVPIVVAVLALAREGIVALAALVLAKAGVPRFDVTWEGKTGARPADVCLPTVPRVQLRTLLRRLVGPPIAWLFAVPGLGYSYYSVLFQYLPMTRAGWLRAHSDTMR